MDLRRLSNGERIASVSAILLFVFMFFHWFGSKDSGELRLFSVGRSAWEALDYIPIVLLITIIATLAVAALRLANAVHKPRVPVNAVVAILGIVSVLLILFRIVEPPTSAPSRKSGELSRSKARSNSPLSSLCRPRSGSLSVAAWQYAKKASPPSQSQLSGNSC
jgi:uncharacterized membrane protein